MGTIYVSFYRLIKPDWAKPLLTNGEKNPAFIREIPGSDDVIEGYGFSNEELKTLNDVGYNVYFFPNHPSRNVYAEGTRFLSGKVIDVFNYVFVDMDLKDKIYATKEDFLKELSKFQLKPSMVVDSGNGIHAYWKINNLTRDQYVISQLALLTYFKTDPSVFTVMQLMRLPGFNNTKKSDNFIEAKILNDYSSNQTYNIVDFPPEIFSLPPDVETRGRNHLNKLDGKLKIDLPEFVNIDELPDKFIELMYDPGNANVYSLFTNPKEFYGDRSGADMKLANILKKQGLNKKETLSVIANTQKATSKGANRLGYAQMTVDKVYTDQLNEKFLTVGQRLRTQDNERNLGAPVKGTYFFDYAVLGESWRKKELLGLIAGTGVGKTTVTLKWIKDSIENNPENDDVFLFFSLEMGEAEIIKRWVNLVGESSPLADRLYVIGHEDEKGEPRSIGLQEIYEYSAEIKKMTGKNIGMLAIDHIGIISRHIDVRKKFKFGIMSESESGWGDVRTLSLNTLATQLKPLAKMLDTFVIVLTQTTKDKGVGDLPIDKNGAYMISQYENIMDRIITIWQPLMRIQNESPHKFLAWQYVKIRNKHKDDRIQVNEAKLLTFDIESGDLKISTPAEYEVFCRLIPRAAEEREKLDKKKFTSYSLQLNVGNTAEVLKSMTMKPRGTEDGMAKVQSNK